jgi:hypothetical protein
MKNRTIKVLLLLAITASFVAVLTSTSTAQKLTEMEKVIFRFITKKLLQAQ